MLGEGMKRRRAPKRRKGAAEQERRPRGSGMRIWRWMLGGLLGGAAAFGIGYLIAVLVLFPRPALAGDEVAVPDLTGQTLADARAALNDQDLTTGEVRGLAHPTVPRGVVVAQSPLAGQRLGPGAAVRLAVSTGPATVVVPDLTGLPFPSARELAERIGLQVARRNEISMEAAPGTVLRTEPGAGDEVAAESRVTLVVSEAVPAPAFGDTLADSAAAVDTMGGPADTAAPLGRQ